MWNYLKEVSKALIFFASVRAHLLLHENKIYLQFYRQVQASQTTSSCRRHSSQVNQIRFLELYKNNFSRPGFLLFPNLRLIQHPTTHRERQEHPEVNGAKVLSHSPSYIINLPIGLIMAHLIGEIRSDYGSEGRCPSPFPFSVFLINEMLTSDYREDYVARRLSMTLLFTLVLFLGIAVVTVPYLIIRFSLAAVGAVRYNYRHDWMAIREGLPFLAVLVSYLVAVLIATDAIRLHLLKYGPLPSVVLDNE